MPSSMISFPIRGTCSDGHDQIMIEFCSISSLLDHLDHRGLSIRSWSSRASMIWSICSIMGTARSCSTIIEYTGASWLMTDHSTNLSDWVMQWTYIKGVYRQTRYQFFWPGFTLLAPQQIIEQQTIMTADFIIRSPLPSFRIYGN